MTEQRRIGLVAPLPPQVGGVASFAEWLLAHEREIGCRFETFDLWRPPDGEIGGRVTPRDALRQARLFRRFVGWTRKSPPVVHYCVSCAPTGLARDLLFLAVLRAFRRRAIAHVHGFVTEISYSRGVALRLLGRLSAERVVASPRASDVFADLGIGAACISNPLRLEAASANGRRTESSPLRLLLVGPVGRTKGCPELVEALGKVRAGGVDASLRFVGREERSGEADRLRAVARALGVEEAVELVGVIPPDQMPREYRNADVLCLASRREGVPMALLEGMAFGLPVVASRVGGVPDLIEDGVTGLLVDPGDVDGLATALLELAADPSRREELGRAARERATATAASPAVVEQWRSVYLGMAA
jgi:glycosyltransferase involved in cell wall biosynthesis